MAFCTVFRRGLQTFGCGAARRDRLGATAAAATGEENLAFRDRNTGHKVNKEERTVSFQTLLIQLLVIKGEGK